MADKPKSEDLSKSGETRQVHAMMPFFEGAHAPILYIDAAATFGFQDSNIHLALVTKRISPGNEGKPVADMVVTAHLRMSVRAAIDLRDTINNALLLAAPPAGEPGGEPN